MVTKVHNRLPSDFPYQPEQLLAGGAQVQVIRTLDELKTFWSANRLMLPFSVKSDSEGDENWFLEPHEWIFGPSPSAVARGVLRWDQYRMRAVWNDQAEACAAYFETLEQHRSRQIADGLWTRAMEIEFQSNPRTRENYRGWWELTNVPTMFSTEAIYGYSPEEIFDAELPVAQVEEQFQRQFFEQYKGSMSCDDHIVTFDSPTLDEYLEYWSEEGEIF